MLPRRLVGEGAAAREAVVHLPDEVRVAQRLAPKFRRQHHGKVAEVLELRADFHVVVAVAAVLVEEHAEEGLRRACVLDRLRGEEDALRGVVVKGPVLRALDAGVGLVGRVLEEEDYAVEGLEGEQLRGVEGEEFFELDVFDAEVFDERCEDALLC